MPFDWTEYLDVAKFLYQQHSDYNVITEEAACRCAVSRAYYAAFCYTRGIARDLWGFNCKGHEDHKSLPNFIRERKAMPGIAMVLIRLREWRNSCDYDDILNNPNINAEYAIKEAQRIINTISEKI